VKSWYRQWEGFAVGIGVLSGSIFVMIKAGEVSLLFLFFALVGAAGVFWGIVGLFEK